MWDFIVDRKAQILINALNHAYLVILCVIFATFIALALAVLVTRMPKLEPVANAVSAIGLTIPSFALVGLLLPVTGLGDGTALAAVTFYAVLPILRNAVVGLQGVDANLLESARGMGMSEVASLLRVRIPLAWPVILAGIRISLQMSMGIAAIAAYVLGPGLGRLDLHRPRPDRRQERRLLRRCRHRRHRDRRAPARRAPPPCRPPDHLEGNPCLR